MQESQRMRRVQAPIIPIVAEWIRENPGTISLGQGVVYYPPPASAMAAHGAFAADPENHKYKLVDGIPPLRAALERKLTRENGIRLDGTSRLVVTAGGNMAFHNALLAVAEPGDEIILPSPFYFNHEMAITMAGCRAVPVATDGEFQLRLEALREAITPRTRAIVTVSPNNPSGAVYPEAALREVNRICAEHGLWHISDEAYEYFTYDGAAHFSPGSIPGAEAHTISLFSMSKAYGFASWRIGYMVAPEVLLASIRKIQDTILICPPVISQYAAVGALEEGAGYCREKLRAFGAVRATARAGFDSIRDLCEAPEALGAFYYLLRLHTELEPLRLVERLVREHRVAAIPGNAFGLAGGCSIRVSYGALAPETAVEGLGRLTEGLRKIIGG